MRLIDLFRITRPALAAFIVVAGFSPLAAQETPPEPPVVERPAPYDGELSRLSEILGAIHYLRNLCQEQGEPEWRVAMQRLLDTETNSEPGRRSRLTAAFNRGYRSFAGIHATCTPAAVEAERQYRAEGATLATEITARYGN